MKSYIYILTYHNIRNEIVIFGKTYLGSIIPSSQDQTEKVGYLKLQKRGPTAGYISGPNPTGLN